MVDMGNTVTENKEEKKNMEIWLGLKREMSRLFLGYGIVARQF